MRLNDLESFVEPHGLVVLGSHRFSAGIRVLIGNAGSESWNRFAQSAEFSDGSGHPMDRWSKRIGLEIGRRLGARVVFPFEGPPYPPFLEWASRTGRVSPSPITIHIHHQQGLWHAYRFALEFDEHTLQPEPPAESVSPCDSCRYQPCLSACPVNAFESGDYDIHKCKDYLRANSHSKCLQLGCAARRACPVKKSNRYLPVHAQFHMKAFMGQES